MGKVTVPGLERGVATGPVPSASGILPPAPAGPAGEIGIVPGADACGAPLSPSAVPTSGFATTVSAGAAGTTGAGFTVATFVGGGVTLCSNLAITAEKLKKNWLLAFLRLVVVLVNSANIALSCTSSLSAAAFDSGSRVPLFIVATSWFTCLSFANWA